MIEEVCTLGVYAITTGRLNCFPHPPSTSLDVFRCPNSSNRAQAITLTVLSITSRFPLAESAGQDWDRLSVASYGLFQTRKILRKFWRRFGNCWGNWRWGKKMTPTALKTANVEFLMGISCTEVTKQAVWYLTSIVKNLLNPYQPHWRYCPSLYEVMIAKTDLKKAREFTYGSRVMSSKSFVFFKLLSSCLIFFRWLVITVA